MPWNTPTLKEVRVLCANYVMSKLGATVLVPNSPLRIMSDSNAQLAQLTMVYIDWLAKQLMPDTAEEEWLDRFGKIWVGGRKSATFASGTVNVSGDQNAVLPAGAMLRSSQGVEYVTTSQVTIGAQATPVSVIAIGTGSLSNQAAGDTLTLLQTFAGISSSAVVASISGGYERENDDSLRDRILDRIRQPPHGGSANDYVQWAREVPGVTRAWAKMEAGAGTVTVRVMLDEDRAPYGLPLQADLDAVAAYIDVRRPVTVRDIYVVAPVARFITIAIGNLSRNDTAVRASVEAALKKTFRRRAEPGGTMYRSWIGEAISNASREDHHELIYQTTHMRNPGELPILQSVIYR